MFDEEITDEDYGVYEQREEKNEVRYFVYPQNFNENLVEKFIKYISLIERDTKELEKTFIAAEETEEEKKKRYGKYADTFYLDLFKNHSYSFKQTIEAQNLKSAKSQMDGHREKIKKLQDEAITEYVAKQYEYDRWEKKEREALDKEYEGYNERVISERDELKKRLDEKTEENSRYQEFFDNFLEEEGEEFEETKEREIEKQSVAKGYDCGKYHYPKTPGSLEEAKQPWECRVCDATGKGVDSIWTMPSHVKDGFIKSAEIASPLLGEDQQELDAFISAMNQYNLAGIADEAERKKHSPYFKKRSKNGGEKN